jgi:predicted PurR-regulated permease PerM
MNANSPSETAENSPNSEINPENRADGDSPATVSGPPLTAGQLRTYAWWALGVVALLALLFVFLGPIMTPFVLGAIIAYVGHPLVAWLARKRIPRAAGAVLVIILGVGAIVGLIFIVLPLIQSEITQLSESAPKLLTRAQTEWLPMLNQKLGIELSLDVTKARTWLTENLSDVGAIAARLAKSAQVGGLAVLGFLGTLMLTPLATFYLLKDWPQLTKSIDDLIPRGLLGRVNGVLTEIDRVLAEFLRGQLSVMAALAVYYAVGLKLCGLEFGVPIGIITGLLVFVPYVGFGLGLVLALVSALTQFTSWTPIIGVAVVYAIGQVIESFLLTPVLVGERVGLHPLAVLFSLLAFGQLFGFVGVLAAVPASAMLLVALRHVRAAYLGSTLYTQNGDPS